MATAAPFVKLLRQLANAKDEYRSGALDITWEGGKSSLFLVFGQPNHATYETDDGRKLEGQEALAALLHNLPRKFTVAPWRKAVSRGETLGMSLDELMEPFAQLAGAASPEEEPSSDSASTEMEVGTGFEPEFTFGLEDFPLLPMGQSMWSDAAVNVVHLDLLIPKLPTSLIVLTGPKLRAAAVLLNGQLIDAVWVDDQERAAGEGAAMAIMGAREGTVSGYRLEDNQLAEALTMLWRCPPRYQDISLSWLDSSKFLASLLGEGRDCVVRVDGPSTGVAFFMGGKFIAAYTQAERTPSSSPAAFEELLQSGRGTITILQRSADRALGRMIAEESYHSGEAFSEATLPVSEPESAPAPTYEVAAAEMTPTDPQWAEPTPFEAEPSWMEAAPTAETSSPQAAEMVSDVALEPALPEAQVETPDMQAEPTPLWATADPLPPSPSESPPLTGWAERASPETEVQEGFTHLGAEGAPEASPSWPSDEPVTASPWDTPATSDEQVASSPWAASVDQTESEPMEHPEPPVVGQWPPSEEGPAAESPAPIPPSTDPDQPAPWFTASALEPTPTPPATTDAAPWSSPVEQVPNDTPSAGESTTTSPALFSDVAAGAPTGTSNLGGAGTFGADDDALATSGLDFTAIKDDLIQIGVLWLGNDDVAPIAELIRSTKSSVDDFVATIEAIKGMSVVGHDPSVIRAMAREMHYHAAEYLSGV